MFLMQERHEFAQKYQSCSYFTLKWEEAPSFLSVTQSLKNLFGGPNTVNALCLLTPTGLVRAPVVFPLPISMTQLFYLKMEVATQSYKMLVTIYQATWHQTSGDNNLQ